MCLSVFNGADTLAQSLASVFAQTYRDFDVLVLDDGSTDNSAEIAAQFDCRVLKLPNGGRGAALKRMVEEADGEYVALIDHDDIWLPEKLAKQIDQLDTSGASLVHTDCWYEYSDGRIIDRDLVLPNNPCSFDHILPSNDIIASSAVFRREDMLASGNFAPDTLRCCDWYGWLVLAPGRQFDHIPEKLVRYKVLNSSLANAGYRFFEAQHYLLTQKILPRTHELFADLPPSKAHRYKRQIVEKAGIALSSMARAMEGKGDKRAARALHRRALKMAPGVIRVWTRAFRSITP